jgi:hypothetical protein
LYGISFRWPAVLSSAGASTSGTWLIDWLISRFSYWGFCCPRGSSTFLPIHARVVWCFMT